MVDKSDSKTQVTRIKIWLDDERDAPEGWKRCLWPEQVVMLIVSAGLSGKFKVTDISLDHDLGEDNGRTGYDVIRYIQKQLVTGQWNGKIPNLYCHSDNPVGRKHIELGIASILRLSVNNEKVETP